MKHEPQVPMELNQESSNVDVHREDVSMDVLGPQIEGADVPSEEDDEYNDGSDESQESEIEGGFRRLVRLPEFSFARRNIAQLIVLLNDSKYLDIAPAYQRDVVWPRKRMSGLINSLLQNFYVPPVLFNVTRVEAENGAIRYKRTCMDGKQRLSSIRDFMNGRLPCHDRKGNPWFYCIEKDAQGNPLKKYMKNILPDSIKEEFDRKDLLCCEYLNLTETQEREIFQRVQLGIPLTAAEKVRATAGAWQEFAQSFELDFPRVVNLTTNTRASGFRRILQCFSQIYETQDPTSANGIPRLKHSSGALERFCKLQESLNAKTKAHLRSVFDLFDQLVVDYPEIFGDNGYTRNKSFSPMELVSVSVLLSVHGDRQKGMLRGDVLGLRDQLRSKHVDLRMHERIWKTAWDYIDDLERYRGSADGTMTTNHLRRARRGTEPGATSPGSQLDARNSMRTSRKGIGLSPMEPQTARKLSEDAVSAHPSESSITLPQRQRPIEPVQNAFLRPEESNALAVVVDHAKWPPIPAIGSPVAPTAPMGTSTAVPFDRKRINHDLGTGSGAASALAAKRKRLNMR